VKVGDSAMGVESLQNGEGYTAYSNCMVHLEQEDVLQRFEVDCRYSRVSIAYILML
jgi:hypothetical protein